MSFPLAFIFLNSLLVSQAYSPGLSSDFLPPVSTVAFPRKVTIRFGPFHHKWNKSDCYMGMKSLHCCPELGSPFASPFPIMIVWFREWFTPLTYYVLLTDEWSFRGISEKEQGKCIPGRGISTSEVSVADGSGFMWRLENANVVRDLKTRVIYWAMGWVGSEISRSWIMQGLSVARLVVSLLS